MTSINVGELVRHPQLGIGRVDAVSTDAATVAFRSGAVTECAPEELDRLSSDGFWQAVYANRENVIRRLREDPAEIILLVLRDMPANEADVDAIASELAEFVPNWDEWWRHTGSSLAMRSGIDSSRSDEGIYSLAVASSPSVQELYRRFRALPRLRSASRGEPSVNPSKIEAARSTMVALSRMKTADPEIREDLRKFVLDISQDDRTPVREQVDLVLRGGELGWLSRDELATALHELCGRPIRIYELGRFAQRRIVGAILEHVGFPAGRQSLVTAFAAERQLILEMREACLAHGRTEVLLDGLRVGLTENLLGEDGLEDTRDLSAVRRWYASLDSRLQGLSEILEAIAFDTDARVDSAQLLQYMSELFGRLSRLAAREVPLSPTVDRLVGFWRRAMAFSPPYEQDSYLSIPSSAPMHAAIMLPLLRAVFRLDPSLYAGDALIRRIGGRDWQHLKSVLEHIVRQHWAWDSEVDALLYLCDRLAQRDDVVDWIADWTLAAVHEQRSRLPEFQPVLDWLSRQQRARARVQGLRQEAVQQMCRAVRDGRPPDTLPSGFDDATLAGLADFIHEVEAANRQELDAQRARTEEALGKLRTTQTRLQESETALDELRHGYRQPERETRFAERRRILEALTATAAEIEHFAAVRGSKELEGVARRLNSVFEAFGVRAYGTIGETVAFRPSEHEIVGELDSPSDAVTVIERGYTIRGLDDRPQVLRPARVEAAKRR